MTLNKTNFDPSSCLYRCVVSDLPNLPQPKRPCKARVRSARNVRTSISAQPRRTHWIMSIMQNGRPRTQYTKLRPHIADLYTLRASGTAGSSANHAAQEIQNLGATDLQIAFPCSPEVCVVTPVSNGPVHCGKILILTKRQRIWSSAVTLTLPTNIACPSSEPPKLMRGRPGWSGSGSVPRMRSST